ncbi:hypothetical protein ZEAMMB73_Zm00001d042347 [Zea mays]|uniref:Uncharacterized protein n=1 Tax=Zea mays TaxID=4577 RepID=A0A1D6N348_MAIZE|nr:hypothetical protein ZEAMMB73_Zm00001d042347 [Zea mays]
MDGHATPDFSPAAGSFVHTTARSENSAEGEGGEPRATYPPPEKVALDPPSPAIRLSCDSWATVVAAALLQVPRSSPVPLPPPCRRRAPARKEAEPWGRESQLLSHLLRSGWTSLTLSFPAHSATTGVVLSAELT